MKQPISIMVLMIMSLAVSATTLSWEPPTTRVDGQTLDPATELAEYRLYCEGLDTVAIPAATSNGEYEVPKTNIFPGYGAYDCGLTAVDTEGLESTMSNMVVIPWEKTKPNAPTNLLIIN
jgi:hypothetical protein